MSRDYEDDYFYERQQNDANVTSRLNHTRENVCVCEMCAVRCTVYSHRGSQGNRHCLQAKALKKPWCSFHFGEDKNVDDTLQLGEKLKNWPLDHFLSEVADSSECLRIIR